MDCGIMRSFTGQTRSALAKSPMIKATKATFVSILVFALGISSAASAKGYKLDELLDLARKGNPGLAAGEKATAGIEAQLLEAKRSYYPTGELNSLLAQAPEIRCYTGQTSIINGKPVQDERNCVNTGEAIGASSSGFLKAI